MYEVYGIFWPFTYIYHFQITYTLMWLIQQDSLLILHRIIRSLSYNIIDSVLFSGKSLTIFFDKLAVSLCGRLLDSAFIGAIATTIFYFVCIKILLQHNLVNKEILRTCKLNLVSSCIDFTPRFLFCPTILNFLL